ncbi:cytochrome c oxidase subunit II [Albimonas sp. CAU 1670]|uniref:cytochrome c oxidase subunit II n=1 Tax=Albimonas sp. CAU 1670 TaxID=3032599 RepID=UPI0023DCCD65|nr:cytochrome c oxidase subunit II [Albimonas sp. CAU 1670]MDF2235150.1 cytochrome c oxidase subunit II [Albimonas sp. CAU 1670]
MARRAALIAGATALAACDGPQSALAPRATQAGEVADLFLWMCIGAAVIWIAVMGAAVLAVARPALRGGDRRADRLIVWGGVVFPTVTLAALLAFGLTLLPDWADSGARVKVHVTGEQFWWRVEYEVEGREGRVPSANEVRLPAGEPVEFVLTAHDVIHSFWIPSLAGKMDMIPGRTTRLLVENAEPGTYRGVCAEFCGPAHAQMAFAAVVMPPEEFDAWLARQADPAAPGGTQAPTPGDAPAAERVARPSWLDAPSAPAPADPQAAARGAELFRANGCGGCHRVAGVVEAGASGPDLTRFGDRLSLGAGIEAPTPERIAAWIRNPQAMKPGARMPAYDALPPEELAALARWLHDLR